MQIQRPFITGKQLCYLSKAGSETRLRVTDECQRNAPMYYILLAQDIDRQTALDELKRNDIFSVFHYVPLHSSPARKRYGRAQGELKVTTTQSERLVRLPLWVGLTEGQQHRIVQVLTDAIG